MKKLLLLFLTLTVILSIQPSMAQKPRKVSFQHYFSVPSDMGLDRAKIVAAEEARLEAVAREFGRAVSHSSLSVVEKEGDDEKETFIQLSGNNVKGVWIADTKEPVYSFSTNDKTGEVDIVVKVSGLVSELPSQTFSLDTKILRNGTEDRFESQQFKSGDWFFVSLTSPVKGYVSIFLEDNARNVLCMVPYSKQTVGSMAVEADEKQIFFSYDDAPMNLKNYVVQYSMTCDGNEEMDVLYIVFSTEQFVKPASADGMLSFSDFNKWLVDLYGHNSTVKVLRKPILIRKKE